MTSINNPHDKFFKETFSRMEVARDFVVHHLPPDIRVLLDPSSLQIHKDSFVDEVLKEGFSDLLYRVDIKGEGGLFVYLLFEHKSYPDRDVALYLLLSMCRIWIAYRKQVGGGLLPPVLPLVVYHGKSRWKVKRSFQEMVAFPDVLHSYVPKFDYSVWDLSRYRDEDIKGGVFLRVAFLLMKHIFREDLGTKLPGFLRLLKGLHDKQSALQYLETALRYVSSGGSHVSREDLLKALNEISDDEGDDIMATLAEQWIEEGVQKGMQQGMEQGTARLLVRQISKRFQAKADSVNKILEGLKTEAIEELGERFLDAESLDEIRAWAEETRRGVDTRKSRGSHLKY